MGLEVKKISFLRCVLLLTKGDSLKVWLFGGFKLDEVEAKVLVWPEIKVKPEDVPLKK